MNRNEFMSTLERSLGSITDSDKNDILYDYMEHFSIGMSQGKNEAEICAALGDPRAIAKQYKVDCIVRQASENRSAGNMLRAVFAAVSLGFFNVLFILPVFVAFIAVLISFYAAAFSVVISGILVFLAVLLQPALPSFINIPDINAGIMVFTGIGVTAMGLLFTIGTTKITKAFYNLTIKYIKANIKIISK